jgi:DNA repair protein RecO
VDDAFVLNTQTIGEADLIVSLLTSTHGAIRAVARSGRASRKRFGGRLEPLTRVRAGWTEREGHELHRLEQLEAVRSFAAMQAEPRIQAACAVLAEVTAQISREGQAEPEAFRLLGAVLAALEAGGPARPLLRYFEYWTLRIHGLLPDLAHCAACGRSFEPLAEIRVGPLGAARCAGCPAETGERQARLTELERRFLEAARRLPPEQLPAEFARLPAAGALDLLLRGTLEHFAERSFRTYRHLAAAEAETEGPSA